MRHAHNAPQRSSIAAATAHAHAARAALSMRRGARRNTPYAPSESPFGDHTLNVQQRDEAQQRTRRNLANLLSPTVPRSHGRERSHMPSARRARVDFGRARAAKESLARRHIRLTSCLASARTTRTLSSSSSLGRLVNHQKKKKSCRVERGRCVAQLTGHRQPINACCLACCAWRRLWRLLVVNSLCAAPTCTRLRPDARRRQRRGAAASAEPN